MSNCPSAIVQKTIISPLNCQNCYSLKCKSICGLSVLFHSSLCLPWPNFHVILIIRGKLKGDLFIHIKNKQHISSISSYLGLIDENIFKFWNVIFVRIPIYKEVPEVYGAWIKFSFSSLLLVVWLFCCCSCVYMFGKICLQLHIKSISKGKKHKHWSQFHFIIKNKDIECNGNMF